MMKDYDLSQNSPKCISLLKRIFFCTAQPGPLLQPVLINIPNGKENISKIEMEIVYSVIQYKSQNLNVDKIGKANRNFNLVLTIWRMKESMSMRSLSTSTNL